MICCECVEVRLGNSEMPVLNYYLNPALGCTAGSPVWFCSDFVAMEFVTVTVCPFGAGLQVNSGFIRVFVS